MRGPVVRRRCGAGSRAITQAVIVGAEERAPLDDPLSGLWRVRVVGGGRHLVVGRGVEPGDVDALQFTVPAAGAGEKWADLSDEVLYRPLGMASTSSRFADYAARSDRAVGHIHVDGRYEPAAGNTVRDADAQSPAGGVSSSVNDMARWMTMLLGDGSFGGHQIVDPKALLPALTPQITSDRASDPAMRSGFYGYGFNVGTNAAGRVQLSHSGAFELGAGSNFLMIPAADVAIVALTNATPSGVAEALTAQFADLVQSVSHALCVVVSA